jgi:hypothetical protein
MTIVPNSGPLMCGRFGHLRSLTDAFGVSIAKLGAGAHSDELLRKGPLYYSTLLKQRVTIGRREPVDRLRNSYRRG